ncbi:MAG TPA: DUF4404 family protein [Pirellulales bacterium]|nr:DUF4404 family protein [Pirellulales bacterium]
MPQDAENFRATLAELHRQLDAAHSLDPSTRDMVRQAIADIEHTLARDPHASARGATSGKLSRSEAAEHASVVRRLGDAAREFEATHPTLSGSIGSVIDALAQMGI